MIHLQEKEDVTCVKAITEKGRIVYTYLVDGMLIDTGAQSLEKDLIPFYKNHSFEKVALTHSHEDHTGTAPWIQENLGVPIYIHPTGIDICSKYCPYPQYRQNSWGIRKEFEALPIGDTIDSRNQEWKIIYTPGHADDHISLFDEETGRLFSGDLFLATKTKLIMDTESVPVMISSIRELLTFDFETIFCSHAGYLHNGRRLLKQKLDYLVTIYGEVDGLYAEGISIEEIDRRLFPKRYPIVEISKGEFNSINIILSIIEDIKKENNNPN